MKLRHIIILMFLSVIPLILFRDYTPSNELRYLNIADEAIANGNFFAFYDHGIPYADKPPLYLWIVMLGKVLFGEHIMLFLALFPQCFEHLNQSELQLRDSAKCIQLHQQTFGQKQQSHNH